ncbi:putative gata transcription factor protein [Golovinomyces cichoracearum]|uniref:Putative gata transcription factor protein n=1 Tax=Golovinomyces cichoracearum TaxID=62708 RepID=A0A420IGE2_9PEZI|nr:putative gata transcription factor protein [Golovinomyces cichoracearum]
MATSDTADHNHEESIRSMRLKILYTFDGQNKTNHLARWPDVLPIRKISIDQTTTVGVVLLQTCLRAIIEASPELITGTNQDYTIYTHDFSESDYPLFGQGLLSRALSTFSPSSDSTPANPSKQLITGRVYHDAYGIFSSDVKETLEVRMKLVPVPTLDVESIKSICKCRQNFCAASYTSNVSEWDSLNQADLVARRKNCFSNNLTKCHKVGANQVTWDQPNTSRRLQKHLPFLFNCGITENSGNESTEDSDVMRRSPKNYKSSSKMSAKRVRDQKARMSTVEEIISSNEEIIDKSEAVESKKRFKKNKAQRNSSTTFERSPSLGVPAITSGSLRLLRPSTLDSSPNKICQTESSQSPKLASQIKEQKNVITKPKLKLRLRRNSLTTQESSLHLEKKSNQPNYPTQSIEVFPERNCTSSDTETPPGMTSSPPVMKPHTPRIRSITPCPSSPSLPQLPLSDSGYIIGNPNKNAGEINVVAPEMKGSENEAQKNIKNLKRRYSAFAKSSIKHLPMDFIIEEECPGPMDQLPTKMPVSHQHARARCAVSRNKSTMSDDTRMNTSLRQISRTPPFISNSQNQSINSNPPDPPDPGEKVISGRSESMIAPLPILIRETPKMTNTTSKDSFPRSKIPASDPILPHSRLQYSQNKSKLLDSVEVPIFKIPIPAQSKSLQPLNAGPASLVISQSFSKKEMIKQKLENAVANGEMPPFCCNCGAIETPTWRKAWSKEMKGQPGYFEYSDEPGRVTAIIILSRDSEGNPTSYNLIKKYLGKDESQDDYNEYLLCNPCGIWMSKYKTSRPEERWENNSDKTSKVEPKKRPTQRLSRSKKNQGSSLPTPASEASHMPSDSLFPLNEAVGCHEAPSSLELNSALFERQLLKQKEQAAGFMNNLNAKSKSSVPIKQPETQSSPVRSVGTRQSPIDLENDLGNTRRLLFPSPLKDMDSKIADEFISDNITKVKKVCSSGPDSKKVDEQNTTPKSSNENIDARILQLFDEDSKIDNQCLTITAPDLLTVDLFKTPPQKSPRYGVITRSMSRSSCSVKSSRRLKEFRQTSSNTHRCSTDIINDVYESPFTATLNQLISESNKSKSPVLNLDFGSLPAFSEAATSLDMDISFTIEDFFPDDILNSNPCPDLNFNLQENPVEDVTNINWQNLSCFNDKNMEDTITDISVKQESLVKSTENLDFETNRDC